MIYLLNAIRIASYIWGLVIAIYGWGIFITRLTKYHNRNYVINFIIGLGVVLFFGGIFNLLKIAYGWVFDILFLIGIVLLIKTKKFKLNWPKMKSEWFHLAIVGLVIIIIIIFTLQTQLHPKAYNYHDDYEKYFAHPIRMLQTGTLFGSPLSALGSETMGGQAVLHGIFISHFPISYINGVDAVFGLFVCLILVASIGSRHIKYLPISVISLLMVFFINPQYVNISACYIAISFMMAAILLLSNYSVNENDKTNDSPPAIILGLIYAALIALKSSFIFFPIIHISLYVIVQIIFRANIKRLASWCFMTVGFAVLFILPWVLLHFPHYIRSSFQSQDESILTHFEFLKLFSWKQLFYENSFAHYTFLCISTVFFACVFVLLSNNKTEHSRFNQQAGLISSVATVISSYFLFLLLSPMLNGYETNLRYAIPYLIACVPITFTLACHLAISNNSFRNRLAYRVLLLTGTLILVGFSNSLYNRIQQAYKSGSILAFSDFAGSRNYLKYNEYVLHGNAKSRIVKAQGQVPPGCAIVAWVTTQFYLDYKRNIIYDAEPAGIANPWAYIPMADYFMLEYHGFAVRPFNQYLNRILRHPGRNERNIAKSCYKFLYFLNQLRQNSHELYNDGGIVVFKKK